MGVTDNFFILFGDTFHRVDYHQYHVGTIYGAEGTHNTVFFNQLFNFTFAAHPCGINEQEPLPFFYHRRIDGIPGRTGLVTDNRTFFPYQCVEDRGFSHVRPADQGYLDFIFIFFI